MTLRERDDLGATLNPENCISVFRRPENIHRGPAHDRPAGV